jgi:hypothetical protein
VNHSLSVAGCFAALALAPAALAQSFNFPNFASVAPLTLNGAAVQSGTSLRLVNNGSAQTGSAWHSAQVSVAEGFSTEFEFVMTPSPEGFAFVIQDSLAGANALGGGLWGLGYGYGGSGTPISNSLAIEVDAVQNGFLSDTSGNEVSLHTTGVFGNSENEGVSIARITPTIDLSNNAVHRIRVNYTPGQIEVFIDNMLTPALTAPFTFEAGGTQLSGGSTGGLGIVTQDAYVGFTASTSFGSSAQNVELRSWTWTSLFQPDACYRGNLLLGSGGPFDTLTLNGTTGGFFRNVRLPVADPFTVAIAPPAGQTATPFLLYATIGIANAATVTPTPFGNACFPLLLTIDLGGGVAPQSLPVPPGLAIPFPLTFQAVMATDPLNPSVVELSNAIGLEFFFGPAPTISTVTPNSAVVGGTITVNGNNFSLFATVTINGVPVTPLTLTKTQTTFAMPAGVPCGTTLRVTNPDGAFAQANFNPNPTVTNQIGTQGPAAGGTQVIFIGTGMAAGSTVTFNGVPATVSSAAATVVVCIAPPGTAGPATVVLTTPGGCTINRTFTYL